MVISQIYYLTAAALSLLFCSYTANDSPQPITARDTRSSNILLRCDTVIVHNGYHVHIIRNNGEDIFVGLDLFAGDMKKAMDMALLQRIESDLYTMTEPNADTNETVTKITKGKITDFKSVTPETPCSVSTTNSKDLVARWDVEGKSLMVKIPISYQTAHGSDRSKTEKMIINRIKQSVGQRTVVEINQDNLEAYGEEMFVLPGGTYHNNNITANVYLDSSINPIWNVGHPAESMANLFLLPSPKYGNHPVALTILLHEYGEKETLHTTVDKIMDVFEKDGCMAFWGVEKISDGIIEGVLFLYNQVHGYDHVMKIECSINDLINATGEIKARANLYIPTNNVDNLYAPYVKKSEEEKINYAK